jgi:FlaA1/EpsC-like NDP-sugar epimerase
MKKTNSEPRTAADARVVITGGTGSLGQVLVWQLLGGEIGMPAKVIVFSRDEAEQHQMRLAYRHTPVAAGRGHRLRGPVVRAVRERDRLARFGRAAVPAPDCPGRSRDDQAARHDEVPAVLSLDRAVDAIVAAVRDGQAGETYIPRVPSTKVVTLAEFPIAGRDIPIVETGIRPGEKVREILMSEEEMGRTICSGEHYVIRSILAEVNPVDAGSTVRVKEYSSADDPLPAALLRNYLARTGGIDPAIVDLV